MQVGDVVRTLHHIGPRYRGIPEGTVLVLLPSDYAGLFKVRYLGQNYYVSAGEVHPVPPKPTTELIALPASEVRPGDERNGKVVGEVRHPEAVEFIYKGGGVSPVYPADQPMTVRRPVETVTLRVRRSTAERYSRNRPFPTAQFPEDVAYNDVIQAAKAALQEENQPDD